MVYIVEIDRCVWIAPWEGDPGRTLVKDSARIFLTLAKAKNALKKARNFRPFPDAKITEMRLATLEERTFLDELKAKFLVCVDESGVGSISNESHLNKIDFSVSLEKIIEE